MSKIGAHSIDGIVVSTKIKELWSANIIEVECGTNGYQGGDSGHGCRTYIRISDEGGTDISFKVSENIGNGQIEIVLGGDTELTTICKALKFIRKTLKKQIKQQAKATTSLGRD